jgi:hypothetical protein
VSTWTFRPTGCGGSGRRRHQLRRKIRRNSKATLAHATTRVVTQLSTLTRVCQGEEISYVYQIFFITSFSLVNRACSWLYCIIKKILSKKSWLAFSPSLGFS